MAKRKSISKKSSKKIFKKGMRINTVNNYSTTTRGGIRL